MKNKNHPPTNDEFEQVFNTFTKRLFSSEKKAPKKELNFLYEEKKRKDNKEKHLHIAFIILVYVVVLLVIIRIAHFITPQAWSWLSHEQMQSIQDFLFSGAVGGAVSKYGASVFGKTENK